MAKGFRPVLRDQPFLLPPDLREWLPPGHLAWFVLDVVEALDLSGFAARATPRGSAAGRAAYDPRVLLGLLVYGYATGVRSSRRIERACWEDVAFRVICAQDVPDHATIARFRRQHFAAPETMAGVFAQVLVLAGGAGLGRLGLIGLDGTKIAANASKSANRSEAELAELAAQILAEAEETDAAEDALFGPARGDELPGELADPVTRRERILRARADLAAGRQAAGAGSDAQAEAFRQRRDEGKPPGRAPRGKAGELAAETAQRARARHQARCDDWDQRNAARLAATGTGLPGPRPLPPDQYARVRHAEARAVQQAARDTQPGTSPPRRAPRKTANITDPDSRLMPVRGGGFIQGYNAQAAFSSDGLCLAALVTADTTDYASYEPVTRQVQAAAELLRAHANGPLNRLKARPGIILADAGYLSDHNLTCPGPDRLIATRNRRAGTQPPQAASAAARAMTARLTSYPGKILYRQRAPIAEAPFGNTKHNQGFRQFSLRGISRAGSEWIFQNTAANLRKIHACRPATAT